MSTTPAHTKEDSAPRKPSSSAIPVVPQIFQATMVDSGSGPPTQGAPTMQHIATSAPTQVIAQQIPQVSGTTIIAKPIPLDHASKITMKSTNIVSPADYGKLVAPTPQVVRLITPTIVNAGDRQTGSLQVHPGLQQAQQNVPAVPTSIPLHHMPRGPTAVATLTAPRSTIATFKLGTCGEPVILRTVSRIPGNANQATQQLQTRPVQGMVVTSTPQWQSKANSPVVYTQNQRHPGPVASRTPARPATPATFTTQSATRIVAPNPVCQGRPVQRMVVTTTPSTVTELVLQTNHATNNIARIPVNATRPPYIQVTTQLPGQAPRPMGQQINQLNQQTTRPTMVNSATGNRISLPTSVIGTPNRLPTGALQTLSGKKVTITPPTCAITGVPNRIVIPQQVVQPVQQHQPQQAPPTLQSPIPISFALAGQDISRIVSTTSANLSVGSRITQTQVSQPVARITNMSLHTLPLTAARQNPVPLKVTQTQNIPVQLKSIHPSQPQQQPQQQAMITTQPPMQSQNSQQQQQVVTQQQLQPQLKAGPPQMQSQTQQHPQQSQQQSQPPTLIATGPQGLNLSNYSQIATPPPPPITAGGSAQYLQYYSIDNSGNFPQYRPAPVQSVKNSVQLLMEQAFDEAPIKPNVSPRPSILRKREHDNSPAKGIAKNLAPVLASLQASSSMVSPPGSPKHDRDGGGNMSSGSTTVSATSSPGLDDEPEQSRIPMNPIIEMSPRKKPRKQQLTGVELTESRCTAEEEMQFISEDKIKREIKEEPGKEKLSDNKRAHLNVQQQHGSKRSHTESVKKRQTPSLLSTSWKCKWTGRQNHYRRPSDVRPREERRPTVSEIAQQKQVLQKVNGWKIYHLTAQMEDLAELEKQVHDKLKVTLNMLESQQGKQSKPDEGLERVNELIKGNMQRSHLISEGMNDARKELSAIFTHKSHVTEILQRCVGSNINKRTQKKRDINK